MTVRVELRPPGTVAILAGGASRRMGRNKALIPLPPDGETIIARIVRHLGPLTDDLLIIGPRLPEFRALPARVVSDDQPGLGPLGGLRTALAAARNDRCLVVACDMPLVSPALATALLRLPLEDCDAQVPIITVGGAPREQPLFAVYHRRCLPLVVAQLGEGDHRMRGLLSRLRACYLDEGALRTFDPALLSFLNANDPAGLAEVIAALSTAESRGSSS